MSTLSDRLSALPACRKRMMTFPSPVSSDPEALTVLAAKGWLLGVRAPKPTADFASVFEQWQLAHAAASSAASPDGPLPIVVKAVSWPTGRQHAVEHYAEYYKDDVDQLIAWLFGANAVLHGRPPAVVWDDGERWEFTGNPAHDDLLTSLQWEWQRMILDVWPAAVYVWDDRGSMREHADKAGLQPSPLYGPRSPGRVKALTWWAYDDPSLLETALDIMGPRWVDTNESIYVKLHPGLVPGWRAPWSGGGRRERNIAEKNGPYIPQIDATYHAGCVLGGNQGVIGVCLEPGLLDPETTNLIGEGEAVAHLQVLIEGINRGVELTGAQLPPGEEPT